MQRNRPADARNTRTLRLDGQGHVVLPGFNDGFGEGYTVEGWVCLDTLQAAPIVDICDYRGPKGEAAGIDASGTAFDRITLQTHGTQGDLQLVTSRGQFDPSRPGGIRILVAKEALKAGRWAHIAATVLSSGLAILHVDGRRVAERVLFSAAEVANDSSVVRRNALLGRSAGPSKQFDGSMAELRIWSRALTNGEIRDRRFLRASGNEFGLARCYHLDDVAGRAVMDVSPHRKSGAVLGGGLISENVDVPLWPSDDRLGAGVDATCKLMQDPRIVKTNGKTSTVHVPVYEVCLVARSSSGMPLRQTAIEIAVDEPVTLRPDQGDDVDVLAAPKMPVTITTNAMGKARLTINAHGFKANEEAVVRCPALKVRIADMPAGQYDVILPDLQALEVLAGATGDSLTTGIPARNGRKQTPSPFGQKVSAEDAAELAATVRGLMQAASQSTLEYEEGFLLSFAEGSSEEARGTIASAVRPGAAARIDADVPLRRTIPGVRVPMPESDVMSFSAGEAETILDVQVLAAPGFGAMGEGLISFGTTNEAGRIRRARRLRDDRVRLGDRLEAAGDKIEAAFKEFGEKTEEFFKDVGDLVKEAVIEPADKFFRNLGDRIDDAMIVVVKTLDPRGWAVEAYQIVVEVGGKLIRTIVDSVETAVAAMSAFFKQVAASIEKVINYVAALFDWEDILDTADALHEMQRAALARFPGTIRAARNKWNALMTNAETTMTTALDRVINSMGVAEVESNPSDPDERTSFLMNKLENNLGRLALDSVMPNIDFSLLDRIVQAFDVQGIRKELDSAIDSIDWKAAVADPKAFFTTGATVILLGVRALLQLLMRLIKVGGALLLELVEQVADWLVRLANGRIDIPWVTDFIETTILRGRPLTLLSLFSVIAAVPYTIIYKLAKGTTEGPFAEFASFAAQDDADDAKVQAEIEAQIDAAMAETEKARGEAEKVAEKNRQNAAYAKAACGLFGGTICSVATMIADLGDEKSVIARSARLVAAIVGAAVAGITGFPTTGTKVERGLATTGWFVGLIGAVIAMADGVVGLLSAKSKGDKYKKIGEAFAWVTAGWGVVVVVWEIVGACIAAATTKRTSGEKGVAGFATAANICGGLSMMSTVIPEEKIVIQIAVNGAFIILQLGFGVTSLSWQMALDS